MSEKQHAWLPGDGEMAERTRALDWSKTPLGAIAQWPRSLCTIVSVILTSRHPMFLWWGPELIQFYNDAYRTSLGQDRHPHALGARGRETWAEIWDAIGPQIEAVVKRGESTWNEDHLVPITRDGRLEEVYWTYSYSPVLDDDARIGGILVTVQETTRRVQSERRLAMLRALAERTTAAVRSPAEVCQVAEEVFAQADADLPFALIYLFGDDGRTLRLVSSTGNLPPDTRPEEVDASDQTSEHAPWPIAAVARSGRIEVLTDVQDRIGELPGGPWPEHPDTAAILPIIRTGQARPYGVLIAGVSPRQRFDSGCRDFFGLLAAQLAASLANAHAYAQERQRADAAVELDRALREIFMMAPAAIAVLRGPEHVFEVANPTYLQLVGGRDVFGKNVCDALPEASEQGFVELLDRVYSSGEPYVGREVRLLLQRGNDLEEVYLDFVYQPLSGGDGRVGGIFVHAVDITSQVRARQAAEQANLILVRQDEELREADRLKDEFLATLSHEIRTPLTSILGWTQMLMATAPSREQTMIGLETIHRSATAQSRLIEDVLDVSRITTGKMRLDRKPTDLRRVIEAAVETVQPAGDARGTSIHLSLEADIGQVVVDPDRVQQMVWNLLSNALKFSPAGATVEVVLRRADAHAIIEVRDDGVGIPKEFLPHLFERFRQADSSSKRSHSGLGLGLALTKNLTELHGGTIEVESESGRGSQFRISLPIVTSTAQQDESTKNTDRGTPEHPLAGIKVLFVDDSFDSRLLFQTMLQNCGAEVTTAGSVNEALHYLRQTRSDVVITDVAMPDRDGYDLLEEIRTLQQETALLPVLALTAQARGGDEQRARSAGFQSYLRKPIDADHLVKEITRHVAPSSPRET
ncbi:MAG TPA: ATP-binding protein [Thermoanaerobaculia bacterium]